MANFGKGIKNAARRFLAIAMLCSLVLVPQVALADETVTDNAEPESQASASSDKKTYSAPVASEKAETVYVFANPDGSVKSTEVSSMLKNPQGDKKLADSSELTDIENSDGDNYFTVEGNDMVWDTQGKDVSYTGTTAKSSPVSVRIRYYLDGREISPEDLAGASGKLRIRYDYSNTATTKALVNGAEETICIPFTFITAILFDNEGFKNVEVKNGKIIDDGDRIIVAGYAVPELQKSLGSLAEDLDIPDYFEVTADVSNFEMKSSLTIATAGLLEDFNADDLNLGELEDASAELVDAMDQIIDATSQLKKGLDALAGGADKIASSTEKLAEGIGSKDDTEKDETLLGGMNTLIAGYNKQLMAPLKESADKIRAFLEENRTNLAVAWEALQGMDKAIDALDESIKALDSIDRNDLDALASKLNELQKNLKTAKDKISKAEKMIAGFESLDFSAVEKGLTSTGQDIDTAGTKVKSAGESIKSAADDLVGEGGAVSLAESAGNDLDAAAQTMSSTRDDLTSASDAIGDVLNSMTAEEREQYGDALTNALGSIGDAGTSVETAGANLSDAASVLEDGLKTKLGSVDTSLDAAVSDMGDAGASLQNAGKTLESIGDSLSNLKNSLPSESDIVEIKGLLDKAEDNLTDKNIEIMDQCIESLKNSMDKLDINELNNEIELLKKYYPQLAEYLKGTSAQEAMEQLQAKLDETEKGLDMVSEGMESERKGLESLASGASALKSGTESLAEGADKAASGTGELLDGLQTFDDEGISQITDFVDGDLTSLKDRLQALTEAAKGYDNFSGITEGTVGTVKFVIETDPIEFE